MERDYCGLEPLAMNAFGDGADQLLASIAISLKRITDALNKTEDDQHGKDARR